ncbi:MAG: helix-turn-helix domain-containing protein [Pseudolysinimonas sp.]
MNALATAPAAPSTDAIIGRNVDFLIWRSREKKATTADALGMSPQSLSQKLAGQRPWTASEIQRAARRFNVSIDTLFKKLPDLDSNQEPID